MGPRRKWIVVAIVAAVVAFVVLRPTRRWEKVEVPNGTVLRDLLTMDIYSPYDRELLLSDSLGNYGEPRGSGSDYNEYVGKHGRLRVYDETYKGEDEEWYSGQWLELHPGKLYLEDVVKKKYLAGVDPTAGDWKLSLVTQDRSLYLTFELDGRAITKITDVSR